MARRIPVAVLQTGAEIDDVIAAVWAVVSPTGDEELPANAVTHNGETVTHNGETVTHEVS